MGYINFSKCDECQKYLSNTVLLELLKTHHKEEQNLELYVDKMYLSVKVLSKITRAKMNASLGQLIRGELVSTSKKPLAQDVSAREVTFTLSFEEADHFSWFFER